MRKIITGLAALAVLGAGLAAATPAEAGPLVTYQIQNATAGGCLKDEGLGAAYLVATCATASNFTRIDGHNEGGVGYYEYKDGSGNCVTADDTNQYFKAGTCAGANTQLLVDPDPLMYSYYDWLFLTLLVMTKLNIGYYIAGNTNTSQGPDSWQLS